MATVQIKGISKWYGTHCILKDIHLQIEKGEFVAVVGPSGCGKSTLLRLVSGLDTVTNGQILINDRCVNTMPPSMRDMAMVFQHYALYPHMTVFDNMAYALKMRGMKKTLIKTRVEEVAVLLQLSDYLNRKPVGLSGGQRQRVAMGRAIVRNPAVFLFDEPLSNLDPQLRTTMRYELKKLHQRLRTTSLYVTHDQTEAMTLADRVVILNKGLIEQVGTPVEVYQKPASLFVAGFIGHFPMNFLPAKWDVTQGVLQVVEGIQLPLPSCEHSMRCGDAVMIGIRSEHLRMSPVPGHDSLWVRLMGVDDLGADKLFHVQTEVGSRPLCLRVSSDCSIPEGRFAVALEQSEAHVFSQESGLRLGGFCE